MRKFLALLLTLALCVSLMPAALAAPATGVYFQLDSSGAPTGNCTPLTSRTISTSDGNKTFTAYWDLTYTLDQTFTFYYYNNAATAGSTLALSASMANTDAQTLGGFNNVSFTPVGTDGKLWQVSFTPTLANEFNMEFRLEETNGSSNNFLAFFQCNAPAEGIYFDAAGGEPVGTCLPATLNNNVLGYWGLNYTSGTPSVLYLYAPSVSSVSLNNVPSRTQVNMTSAGSHLWEITVSAPAAFGRLQFDLNYGRGNIPVVLNDQYVAPYAEGIYLSAANNAPAGPVTEGSRPEENDPWGYWDIPYDSANGLTFYYYNPSAAFFTVAGKPDGLAVEIDDAGDHFWKVTLTAPAAGFGSFEMAFNTAGNNGFPISFTDQYQPTYTVGLYYKHLQVNEGPGIDVPHVSESNGFFTNYPITLPPYVNRADVAFYFYDGTDFTPVDVTAGKGLSIDLFDVSRHTDRYPDGAGKTGWYMIMAYDFTVGHLEYRHTDGNTYTVQLKANFLPDFAFYAHDAASIDHYRMYQVMEENTNSTYADYQYATTLYLKCADSSFDAFTLQDITVSCGQQLYDDRGFMVDWVDDQGMGHYLKPMVQGVDYDYSLDLSPDGKTLIANIFSNESDLNFRIDKEDENTRWQWGAYVNLLAADGTSPLAFNLANQGDFESAKFLPTHLFKQLSGKSILLTQPGFGGSLLLDSSAVSTVVSNCEDTYDPETGAGAITGVGLSMAAYDGAESADKAAVDALAGESTTALMTLEFGIDLPDGQLGGNATVTHMLDSSFVPAGSEVAVYYVADNGTATPVDTAAYENNTLTFTTNHFSSYVVVAKSAAGSGGGNGGSLPPAPSTPADPPAEEEPAEPPTFTDVAEDYWAKSAIDFAAQKGYIAGNADGSFAPAANISRQQIWMILSRVAGSEAENMASAKAWAVENGISDGSTPGASVTRQQLVTLLYRYALLMGMDVSVGEHTNILSYDDAADLAGYAVPAFRWACGAGIINGTTESTLSPLGTATRAQFAVMLQRFTESMAK